MRRAVAQLFSASTPGASWLAELTSASNQHVVRSLGETSTSYSGVNAEGPFRVLTRAMSGKGGKGGKGGPASKAAPPPPPPPAHKAVPRDSVLASAGARLRRSRPGLEPIALLTAQQRQLAEQLMQQPAAPAAADGPAADAAASASEAATAALRGLVPLGLPLERRDVASLVDQALSGAAGQHVHFQPFVFSNVFQSAPAAATYVAAALESGVGWPRIERFFLAAVEADSCVRGVKVVISGRLGRKAGMASSRSWEWGEMNVMALSDRLDYGAAAANTRMGAVGVKVWFRYKTSAVKDVFFPAMGGSHYRTAPAAGALPQISLDELYGAAVSRTTRVALPYSFSTVGWWERSASQQPVENRVSEVFVSDFDPRVGDRLDAYLRRRREEGRKFRSAAERLSYMATTGRFLARQRKAAQLRAAGLKGGAAASLGRRPDRALGRVRAGPVLLRQRLEAKAEKK